MAKSNNRSYKNKTSKSKSLQTKRSAAVRSNTIPFAGVCFGVVAGVVSAMGLIMPMAKSAIASDVTSLGKTIQFRTAADTLSSGCVTPSSTNSGTGTANTAGGIQAPQSQGILTSSSSSNTPGLGLLQVSKVVSGIFGDQSADLSNTGPQSNNQVDITNKVQTTITNTNDANVSNENSQSSNSGNANVSGNTTGGSANTGDSSNTNNSNYTFDFNN